MANNGGVVVPPDSTGKQVDCSSLSVGGVTSYRQRIVIADPSKSANFALCSAGALQVIVTTGALSLAAGTSKIGFIGKISAAVAIAAGTQHIGEVNISVFPALVAGTAHIGEVNVSLMPAVVVTSITNAINISAMPSVNVNGGVAISGTATAIIGGFLDPSGQQRNVVDSANTALRVNVVAGGAGGGIVFGANADGLSATAAAVLVGGRDSAGGGLVRTLLTDSSGRVFVNVNGAVGISGTVALAAGAQHIGEVNISVFPALVAGTAHIGEVNISLMPSVVLAAGANNIGSINNISAAVTVVGNIVGGTTSATAGSSFVLMGGTDGSVGRVLKTDANGNLVINNISANVNVVLQTGTNNIGTIQAISAAVGLAAGTQHIGEVNISIMPAVVVTSITNAINVSAMPTVNVNVAAQSAGLSLRVGGRVKTSASSTVADSNTVPLWMDKNGRQVFVKNHPSLAPSASHGPKVVIISTSATVALIAAPGAGLVAYVDSILVTNGSATLTQFIAYEASATATPTIGGYLAASGGGYVRNYDPPVRVSANTALNGRIKPNASQVMVEIHFHVGVD